jgi:hypothetical protein
MENRELKIPGDRKVANMENDFWNGVNVICTDGTMWHLKTYPLKKWERLA